MRQKNLTRVSGHAKSAIKIAACLAVMGGLPAGSAKAGDFIWTHSDGDNAWGNPNNWDMGSAPGPTDNAFFNDATFGLVELGGTTQTISSLNIDHRNLQSFDHHEFTFGDLALNQIVLEDFSVEEQTNIPANVSFNAPAPLQLSIFNATLNLNGILTTLDVNVSSGFSQGVVNFNNSGNSINGTLSVTDFARVGFNDYGSHGSASLIALNNASATFQVSGSGFFGSDVKIDGFANQFRVVGNSSATPGGDVAFGSLELSDTVFPFFITEDGYRITFTETKLGQFTAISGVSFDLAGATRINPGVITEVTPSASLTVNGTLIVDLDQPSSHSGATNVALGMLNVQVDNPLSASTGVQAEIYGTVFYSAAQSSLLTHNVGEYSTIGGNLNGAVYSGTGQNVTLADRAVIASTAGPLPVRGVDVLSAAYYQGLTSNSQVVTVGDNGTTSIFRGAAIGLYTGDGAFSGTINSFDPNAELEILRTEPSKDFFNATFGTTTGVNFFGRGEVRWVGQQNGSFSFIRHTGDPNSDITQTYFTFSVFGPNAIKNGQSVVVDNGIFFTGEPDVISPGAFVLIGPTGTYFLGDFFGFGSGSPTQGTFTIEPGGLLYATTATPGAGASFFFQPGSKLSLTTDTNTGTGSGHWVPSTADVIIQSPSAVFVEGDGLVLGDGYRLTTPAHADALVVASVGAQIFGSTPGGTTLLTASSTPAASGGIDRRTFDIDMPVSIPAGSTLQVGDANNYTTIDYTRRVEVGQEGTVNLYQDVSASGSTVSVEAGSFFFRGGSATTFSADRFVHNSSYDSAFTGGVVQVDRHEINGGFVSYYQRNFAFSGQPAFSVNNGSAFLGPAEPSVFSTAINPNLTHISVGPFGNVTSFGPADPFTNDNGTPLNPSDDTSLNLFIDPFAQYNVAFHSARLGKVTGRGSLVLGFNAELSVGALEAGVITLNGKLSIRDGEDPDGTAYFNDIYFLSPQAVFFTNASDLVVDYQTGSLLAAMQALLDAGRIVPLSDVGGIPTLLVLFEASALSLTAFNGVEFDGNAVLGKFTYTGDANLDGQVDAFDYAAVDDNFGSPGTFIKGDLNQDGFVDAFDYASIDDTFGAGVNNPLRPAATTEVFIPEPAGLSALALLGGLLARRKRA